MLHLPGKDKMKIMSSDGPVRVMLDRKLIALTPTYDFRRGDSGEKIGSLERAPIALTDTFLFCLDGSGGFGPFKPAPSYRLEGNFVERRFVMKNEKGDVVAKVIKDRLIEFGAFDHYQVQVAEVMDSVFVIACACVCVCR